MVLVPSWILMTRQRYSVPLIGKDAMPMGISRILAVWNLARFAESLLPLLADDQEQAVTLAQDKLAEFSQLFKSHWLEGMRAKLGIFNEEPQDESLFEGLLDLMQKNRADYTNTFRALTFNKLEDMVLFGTAEFAQWHKQWQERLETAGIERLVTSVDEE